MTAKSDFPWRSAVSLDPELARYLERKTAPIPAMDDLAASPTTTEIATTINALFAAMRAAKKMEG